ncbi:MAG: Flp family type IVb pilin [Acidimicrobiaceae bacterium]
MSQKSCHEKEGQKKKRFKIKTESGQATTEYALVLLGAAVIALLVIAWATDGGGAGRIGELFDTVLSGIFDRTDALEQ